jgi:hypothetical protein
MPLTRKTNDVCNVRGTVKAVKRANNNTNSLKGYIPCP